MELDAGSVRAFRCPRWAELPALSLYMDQVLIVLEGGLSLFSEKAELATTSTMINNYVKLKLLTPPVNKKYSKEHIAKLMMICVLKREFSMSEVAGLFELITENRGIDEAYDLFCEELEYSLKRAFAFEPRGDQALPDAELPERPAHDAGDPSVLALEAALGAFTDKLVVQRILSAAQKRYAEQREALKEAQKPQKGK
ncbi:MAG TPA: DUF1836 domain-containing protein [Clostridia bacterium]|nr:DUF1836 domain-containing protein [Clostridia bacterium]